MMQYPIYIDQSSKLLRRWIQKLDPDVIMVLVDYNTQIYCLPQLIKALKGKTTPKVTAIAAGESSKTINTVQLIWQCMFDAGMSRKSLLINLGGGVVGDMGGFAAATYMRGIKFIQIPTTLLSMVDASVGGKTGVDYKQLKNAIGVFQNPEGVWIDSRYLTTLPEDELNSGMAEVIKHSLIADPNLWKQIRKEEELSLSDLIKRNVEIKKAIVKQDSTEAGPRKKLNYGHTIGHAIEATLLKTETPILHGYAVALGMVVENAISHEMKMLSTKQMTKINKYLLDAYPCHPISLSKKQCDELMQFMRLDKKNNAGQIKMSLLRKPGVCEYDITVSEELICTALQETGVIKLT